MSIDPEKVTRFIEETAAEEILPRFRRLADHEVSEKQGGEVVTAADVESERRLTRLLKDHLPGSQVVGEESYAELPGVLDFLDGEDPVWLIDPVDGTANFAAGIEIFAVMVALVRGGETLASWIHEPTLERTATAELGSGAWIGETRLQAAESVALIAARGTLHGGRYGGPELRKRIQASRERLGAMRSLSCAGAEYVRLAAGEAHYLLFTKMKPWDHAPGVLLFGEAGGLARTFDRRPYEPARRDTPGMLLASDEEAWEALYGEILG